MKTEVLKITPALAKSMLLKNKKNRPLDDRLVTSYATIMNNGEWRLSHQGICISQTGQILDGQHRLSAIVKCGKTIPFMVVSGLPDETMTVIDIGKKRTVGDAFHLLEVPNYNFIAASLTRYFKYENSVSDDKAANKRGERYSIHQKYQMYLDNRDVIDTLLRHAVKCRKKVKFMQISSIVALGMHLVLDGNYSLHKVMTFFGEVHLLDQFTPTPASKALSNIFLKYISGSEKMKPKYMDAVIIKAWNAWITSSNVKILKFSETESFPQLVFKGR